MSATRPFDAITGIRPDDIETYLFATGWHRTASKPGIASFYSHPGQVRHQVVIPLDKELLDFTERISEAVFVLADVERRDPREVVLDILDVHADVIRYRLDDTNAQHGLLPFPTAFEFLDNCRQSLLAAACTAVEPRPFYQRLARSEAKSFLNACQLSTERGSFVAMIRSPLFSDRTAPAAGTQLSLFRAPDPFPRKVVKTLMHSAYKLVQAIKGDNISTLVEQNDDAPLLLSANFCEALAGMQPDDSRDGALHIECHWSPFLPVAHDTPQRVTFTREHFSTLVTVAQKLRPSTSEPRKDIFIGRIEALHAHLSQEQIEGDIVLAFQGEDERVLKARISLPAKDYAVACDAHKVGHYVSVRGILHRGPRMGRIDQPTEFRDLQAGT